MSSPHLALQSAQLRLVSWLYTIRLKQTFLTKLYPFPFLGSHDSFFLPVHLEICCSHDNENRLYKVKRMCNWISWSLHLCENKIPQLILYVSWMNSQWGRRPCLERQAVLSVSGQDEELMTKPRERLTCTAPKTLGRDSPDPEARRWNELGKRRETNYDQLTHLIRSPPPTLKLFLWWKFITSFNKCVLETSGNKPKTESTRDVFSYFQPFSASCSSSVPWTKRNKPHFQHSLSINPG